jgi:hypothetical protein
MRRRTTTAGVAAIRICGASIHNPGLAVHAAVMSMEPSDREFRLSLDNRRQCYWPVWEHTMRIGNSALDWWKSSGKTNQINERRGR